MTIYFDMDGTIADFYSVKGWLEALETSNPAPYKEAKPMFHFSTFARYLHKAQSMGYKIGIISWLSKTGTEDFNTVVTETKKAWLKAHLRSVQFDEIHILPYGTPKENYATEKDILFDDEERNRNNWKGTAYTADRVLETLIEILKNNA